MRSSKEKTTIRNKCKQQPNRVVVRQYFKMMNSVTDEWAWCNKFQNKECPPLFRDDDVRYESVTSPLVDCVHDEVVAETI